MRNATATAKVLGKDFPVLYEDGELRIYKNPSREIFIEDIKSGAQMRISHGPYRGIQFTADGKVEPVIVGNMIGWCVRPR